MKSKAVWISYDFGIGGDYPGLYRWLANHDAIECGDSMAFFKYSVPNDESLIDLLKEDMAKNIVIDNKTRIYCVRKLNNKIKGSFIFGNRKGNPWEGYGDVDKGVEDGE